MPNGRAVSNAISAARRKGGVSLLLSLAAILIALLPLSSIQALQFDRATILAGQTYRLLTCHWTHWHLDHLLWDVLTFLFLAFACERQSRPRMICTTAISALFIPIALLLSAPHLQTYRGLSGIDSALFALLSFSLLRWQCRKRQWIPFAGITLFISAFAIKTSIELTHGTAVFVNAQSANFVPVPLAHLTGAAVGIMMALLPARAISARPLALSR
jgi:rhomboid family GlyGly-CTERM serine protease